MVQDGESELGTAGPVYPSTSEEIANYLIIKFYNGMSFKQVLDLHTLILTRIGRDYVKIWGSKPPMPHDLDLQDGAHYVLSYLEDDDEWYYFPTIDGPDSDA